MCLASAIYHHDWLRENIPEASPLWTLRLYAGAGILQALKPLVICPRGGAAVVQQQQSRMTATGVPPHVALLKKVSDTII